MLKVVCLGSRSMRNFYFLLCMCEIFRFFQIPMIFAIKEKLLNKNSVSIPEFVFHKNQIYVILETQNQNHIS